MNTIKTINLELGSFYTLFKNIASLAFGLGIFVMFSYFITIKHAPGGININDGLIPFQVAVIFFVLQAAMTYSIFSLGLGLRPLWNSLQNIAWKLTSLNTKGRTFLEDKQQFVFERAGAEHIIFIFMGLIILFGYGWQDYEAGFQLFLSSFFLAFIGSVCIQNFRTINKLRNKKTPSKKFKLKKREGKLQFLFTHQKILIASFLIVPLFISGVTQNLLAATMLFGGLRSNDATVHIKQPYVVLAEEAGLKGNDSFFGKDHRKFENITVLIDGVGKDTVLQISGKKTSKKIVIPRDHLHVM